MIVNNKTDLNISDRSKLFILEFIDKLLQFNFISILFFNLYSHILLLITLIS